MIEIVALLLGPLVLPLVALLAFLVWEQFYPARHSFAHVLERRRAAANRAEPRKPVQESVGATERVRSVR